MEDESKKVAEKDKEEVKKEETKKKEEKVVEYFESIPILQLISAAQNQNGLRHKEYKRYQGYCSRKIHK